MIKHCKNNNERSLIKYIQDRLQEDGEKAAIEIYTTTLYQVLYDDFNIVNYKYYEFDWVLEFPERNFTLFNEILHHIHLQYPVARSEAVKVIAEIRERAYGEQTNIEVVFEDRRIQSGFDPELRRQIEKALSPIKDDLKIVYTHTWFYSHITMGENYNYEYCEFPKLEIYFPDEDIKQKITKLLQKEFSNEKLSIN